MLVQTFSHRRGLRPRGAFGMRERRVRAASLGCFSFSGPLACGPRGSLKPANTRSEGVKYMETSMGLQACTSDYGTQVSDTCMKPLKLGLDHVQSTLRSGLKRPL